MRLRPHQRRRGHVMVLFTCLSFAFMALAALAIDTGFALLSQKQMNSATDTAALEGLRFRDEIPQDLIDAIQADPEVGPPPASTQTSDDTDWIAWRNKARRALARQRLADLHDFTPPGGMVLESRTGPVTDLKLNADDADIGGDMVSGKFNGPPSGESSQESPTPFDPSGQAPYTRNDFTPYDPAAKTPDGRDALLVRERRTNDNFNTDTRSSGSPIPYLFGQGSMLNAAAKNRGISVRATSIAQGKPVLSVGVANTAGQLKGATPLAVALSWWIDPANGVNATLPLDGSSSDVRGFDPATAVLGQPTPAIALPTIDAADAPYFCYVPLYSDVGGDRVVGFGHVKITVGLSPTLTKLAGIIVPENASPVLSLPLPTGLNFTALRQAQDTVDEPLKVAALVR